MASEELSSHTLYAQLVSKAQTHEHESELYELAQLAGITMDPEVFKIILDLLEKKCAPKAIADVMHSMLKHGSLDTSEAQDIGQGEPHPGHSYRNLSGQGSVSGSAGVTSRPVSFPSAQYSNVTLRSNSGDRSSRGSRGRHSSTLSSSRLHSLQDSPASLSRGERKSRPK